mmetsp:Transcript_16245/g.51058  ORF Transcript_16245/g.51058 Transcript_16245/m.51058 type:complete len:205 (-) Transcript_16245:121-735(-)
MSARLATSGTAARAHSASVRALARGARPSARAAPPAACTAKARRMSTEAHSSCMPAGGEPMISSAWPQARRLLSALAAAAKRPARRPPSAKEPARTSPVRSLTSGTSSPKQGQRTTTSELSRTDAVEASKPAQVRRSGAAPTAWISAKAASRGTGPEVAAAAFSVASHGAPWSCFRSAGTELTAVLASASFRPRPRCTWSNVDA